MELKWSKGDSLFVDGELKVKDDPPETDVVDLCNEGTGGREFTLILVLPFNCKLEISMSFYKSQII